MNQNEVFIDDNECISLSNSTKTEYDEPPSKRPKMEFDENDDDDILMEIENGEPETEQTRDQQIDCLFEDEFDQSPQSPKIEIENIESLSPELSDEVSIESPVESDDSDKELCLV